MIAGFTEAFSIAIIAQVAASLVSNKSNTGKSGLFHLHASVPTLLWIGFALTMVRIAMQWPISMGENSRGKAVVMFGSYFRNAPAGHGA